MTLSLKKDHKLLDLFLKSESVKTDLPAFSDLKAESRLVLEKAGFPVAKSEEYKYTNISKKIADTIENPNAPSPISGLEKVETQQELIQSIDGYRIIFNNGIPDFNLSDAADGLFDVDYFTDLDPSEVKEIGKIEKSEKDPFSALNSLSFTQGIKINIPEGSVIKKPLLLINYVKADENGSCIHPRVFIKAGKNSQATIIELSIYLNEETVFVNSVSEWDVAQNAHIRHYKLQDGHKHTLEVHNTGANVHRDANLTSVVMSLEAGMIRNNLSLNLNASNCEGNMYGLYLLNGKTHVDNHTNVDHTQPHCQSNELYKGILTDHSRGVFNGKIFVRQIAQKTNAFQQNNNILLSEDATVNTKPQLEIWADDVKCSHGCTTGQLDEEALFYLRARGIGKESARALLLYAFAGEVLDKISVAPFKKYCEKLVHERLGGSY
ncbi:Fe-S cluster assembly protein SufD [Cyclobacterium plantarum]|uniref:Fe-S cluster assembly protein SufD n=1 Tax=Cyclobacterium plantarum TaxID=2716263 RepID=A0ABX0HA74_9BACT|nr:Fe-S cluster assembly protein SufD [Cyclobacterium plantarum]NHE57273.1 Fe-S cluster assembly protein SufD [Cyclobacterium plantarum]